MKTIILQFACLSSCIYCASAVQGQNKAIKPPSRTASFIPDFKPEPTLALPAATFRVGDQVFLGGPDDTNYLPNVLMDVFVVPHRIWMEGDSLRADAIHRIWVKTDATGTIPRTELWRADRAGKFDLLVDYDGDNRFSWKLDGLSSFIVEDPMAKEFTMAIDNKYMVRHSRMLQVKRGGVLDNDYSRPKKPLQARKLTEPKHGKLDFHADGTFSYTPKAGFVGFDRFTYQASVAGGKSDAATVLLEITNALANPANDEYTIRQDEILEVAAPGVLANDADADSDRLQAVLHSTTFKGKLVLNADGSFLYTPNRGFTGKDSFAYHVHDGATSSASAGIVTIHVQEPKQKKAAKPLLIDSHMHVWSDDPVRFPFAHPYDAKFMPPKIPASLDILLKEMDEQGVSQCVLVQTISHGWDNRYLVHCLKAQPKRFRGQGLIDPTDPDVAKKLEYWMKEHGLAGVRFSPMYYQGKDDWLNAKTSYPLWQKAEELGAVFNFFIASEQLPKLEDMVRRFPKVKVVIDHLARVDLEAKDPEPEIKKLLALARYPNVFVKVSEFNVLSPSKKYPYRDVYPLVKRVYDAFGPDRLLWGTGFPGATRAQAGRPSLQEELAIIEKEIPFLSAEDRAKILGKNAAKVWGFDGR